MNYREQIEKVAINAQKARAMAKEVGIIPQGAWRYALRKSRNMKTGELLKGRELAEAHKKLGKLSNNAYQQIKSKAGGLAPMTEVGATINSNGNVGKSVIGGVRRGGVKGFIDGERTRVHTHPVQIGESRFAVSKIFGKDKESVMRFGTGKRNPLVADMSGGITYRGGVNAYKNDIKRKAQDATSVLKKYNKMDDVANLVDERRYDYLKSGKIDRGLSRITERAIEKYDDKIDSMKPMIRKAQNTLDNYNVNNIGGDVEGLKFSNNHSLSNIVAPHQDIEAVHASRQLYRNPDGPRLIRSVFFDRTPRKTR